MGESDSFERLKNLDPNHVEINRLGETLKEEEFRQLFVDYVKEIQDSDHKESYEDEIIQLEEEQGNEITFLHPTPCYVIGTSINGNKKCFINIYGDDSIDKSSYTSSEIDGTKIIQWSLPHSMSPPSEDFNNKGERCQVFDVLFHPDTLYSTQKNEPFRDMVINLACDSIENQFHVKLDINNLKFPKMKYKGVAKAGIIRKPSAEGPIERSPEEKEFFDKIYAHADEPKQVSKNVKKNNKTCKRDNTDDNSTYTTPKYVIKHRVLVEFEEFSEHKETKLFLAIPKELIIEVNLPLLKSGNEMKLDVTENMIRLISEKPAKYKLVLSLPYQVNRDDGNAKFVKDLKKLVITLPVRRNRTDVPLLDLNKEDSGVDSDNGSLISLESEEEASENSISNITGTESKSEVTCEPHFRAEFLDENVHYRIPDFSSYVFNNTINFTFNVENVDSESVSKLINHDRKTVHIKFISTSASSAQLYYSFLVKLPVNSIEESKMSIEIWDDFVILHIPFKNCDFELVSFMYGLCEENLQEKFLKNDASHESSGDELRCRHKGILKRSSFVRDFSSTSESGVDNCIGPLDYEGRISIPEHNGASSELPTKNKRVRFSDVVCEELYRFNSIVKKDPRKAQKKAQERRLSEIEEKKEDQPLLNRESAENEKTGMENLTMGEENISSLKI